MKVKYLINPFEKIAGWPALIAGLIIMFLTAVIGSVNDIYFDGVMDIHHAPGAHYPFHIHLILQTINLLSIFFMVWLAGAIFSRSKFRIVDIAGTMALARTPMLFVSLLGFLPILPSGLSDIPKLAIFVLICIIFGIWMIALMYQGFTISLNIKGSKGTIVFIGVLVVAEVISKVLVYLVLSGTLSSSSALNNHTEEAFTIPDGQTIQQTASIVLDGFREGDYKTFVNYCDSTMKKAMNENMLRMAWMQVTGLYGKFVKSNTDTEASTRGEYKILLIPCTFENGKIEVQLTFNQKGQISGMFFN